jgi:hypothetical protein
MGGKRPQPADESGQQAGRLQGGEKARLLRQPGILLQYIEQQKPDHRVEHAKKKSRAHRRRMARHRSYPGMKWDDG